MIQTITLNFHQFKFKDLLVDTVTNKRFMCLTYLRHVKLLHEQQILLNSKYRLSITHKAGCGGTQQLSQHLRLEDYH